MSKPAHLCHGWLGDASTFRRRGQALPDVVFIKAVHICKALGGVAPAEDIDVV